MSHWRLVSFGFGASTMANLFLKFQLIVFLIQHGACGRSIEYTCEDVCPLYNRISVKECSNRPEDCGGCLIGFVKDSQALESDPYHCYLVDFIIKPEEEVEGVEGHQVELQCEFNHEVKCLWFKDDEKVDIDGSGSYAFKAEKVTEDTPTHECNLVIRVVNVGDAGRWTCTCRATSQYEAVKANTSLIVIKVPKPETPSLPVDIYLNEMKMNNETISLEEIQKSAGKHLLCVSSTGNASNITWMIEEKAIKSEITNKSHLNSEEIERYFNQHSETMYIVVECKTNSSRALITIFNQDKKEVKESLSGSTWLPLGITGTLIGIFSLGLIIGFLVYYVVKWRKRRQTTANRVPEIKGKGGAASHEFLLASNTNLSPTPNGLIRPEK